MSKPVIDQLGRPLRDLRISVTDRCNFRCPYCMPKTVFGAAYRFLENERLMTDDDCVRIARAAVVLGVKKVRLTGGEPLLRKGLPDLVRRLKTDAGVAEVAMTTNGWLLAAQAGDLREGGLDRVNVSLDGLSVEVAGRMNGQGWPVERVLAGIDEALRVGLPVKVNMVVWKGVNEDEVLPMAERFRGTGVVLRFIEYMDVGNTNGWSPDQVVPAAEILRRLQARWALEPVARAYAGEVASRYRFADGAGEIGFVTSVTEPFCSDCHRARLSADGKLFTCLFTGEGHDVLSVLRAGGDDAALLHWLGSVWRRRSDRYSEERAKLVFQRTPRHKAEMSYLGG